MPTDETPEAFQLSAAAAEVYEARFVPAFFAQWAPRLLDAADVTKGQRVLDVACGTGVVGRAAAERVGTAGSVTGVDRSDAMLAVARRVQPAVSWLHGDAAALPVGDHEFDVVLCQMAMMFFADPVAALGEMRRAVRPHGAVAVLVPGALPANRPYELFVDIVTRHAGAAARNLVTTYFRLGDIQELVRQFTAAGLVTTSAMASVGESRFGSVEEFVGIEIDSTPLGDRLEPEARTSILADCVDALSSWRLRDGSLWFPFECNLVVARPGA
jgi:ubiquinone/menaquinone biosynthesis C-methylase UbiE